MTDATIQNTEVEAQDITGENTILTDDVQPESTPDGGEKADAKTEAGEKSGADDAAIEHVYDFKTPDGKMFDGAIMDAFKEAAKSANLAPDAAQKMLDSMAPVIEGRQNRIVAEATEQWTAQSRADKEFGGEKFDENMAVAKAALKEFSNPEFINILEASSLGNHPDVIRFMYRVGKTLQQDGNFVTGKTVSNGKTSVQNLYANSGMNP
jgi:hypothetical protein